MHFIYIYTIANAKEKTDKLEFIKIKTFANSSDTIKKGKRIEKIFANNLYIGHIKETYNSIRKSQIIQLKNRQEI